MDIAQPNFPANQADTVAQPAVATDVRDSFAAPDYAGHLKQGQRYWSTALHTPNLAGRSVISQDYDDAAVLKAPQINR